MRIETIKRVFEAVRGRTSMDELRRSAMCRPTDRWLALALLATAGLVSVRRGYSRMGKQTVFVWPTEKPWRPDLFPDDGRAVPPDVPAYKKEVPNE